MRTCILSIAAAAFAAAPAFAAPPAGGTISIEAVVQGDGDPSTPAFVAAVSDVLAAKGFTILEDAGHAAYVAELTLRRTEVGTGTAKGAHGDATPTIGGSAGIGVSIPFSTGHSRLVPLERTELDMRMHKQGDPSIIWHGAAVTVREGGTRKGTDEAVARALGAAALGPYPLMRDDPIGVP